tara:strand:- start:224 stop:511 length:288 start_codon:yes stop_codon:yes gene_type:complete
MDIDKLLESFSALSELLKTPSLQNQIKQDTALGIKIEEIATLVEKIKLQQGDNFLSEKGVKLMLEELNIKISDLEQYCDLNLIKLDFLENLKPFT